MIPFFCVEYINPRKLKDKEVIYRTAPPPPPSVVQYFALSGRERERETERHNTGAADTGINLRWGAPLKSS